jgi:hypothetical protein
MRRAHVTLFIDPKSIIVRPMLSRVGIGFADAHPTNFLAIAVMP